VLGAGATDERRVEDQTVLGSVALGLQRAEEQRDQIKEIREAANTVRRRAQQAEDGEGKEKKMEEKEIRAAQTGLGEERRMRKTRREEKRR